MRKSCVVLAALAATSGHAQPLGPLEQRILAIHNRERAAVGAQPLRWNGQLEAGAIAYAQQLARTGSLVHAPREGRGNVRENLSRVPVGWGPDQLMQIWLSERQYFYGGVYPNVCTGGWSRCAHYTQIIWPGTTDIGCGWASDRRFNWFVCRYSPGGNKDGKTVGAARRASNIAILCAASRSELAKMKNELEQLMARKAQLLKDIARVQRAMQAAVPARYDPSLIERLLGTTEAASTAQLAALSRELAGLMSEMRSIDRQTKEILERLQDLQTRPDPC